MLLDSPPTVGLTTTTKCIGETLRFRGLSVDPCRRSVFILIGPLLAPNNGRSLKMRISKKLIAVASVASMWAGNSLAEGSVCDGVPRVFGSFENIQMNGMLDKANVQICDTKWSSKDDFTNKVRKWDSSFKYADIFSGTGNADVSQENRTIDQDYEQFCGASGTLTVRNYLSKTRAKIGHFVVEAWRDCVINQFGLWSQLKSVDPNTGKFQIEVSFKGTGNKLTLRTIAKGPGEDIPM
jgi:hypothetical protein